MKKVLIISYYWPPAGGPGSQRVVKFAKYLPQFGWHPVILTVKKGEFPYLDDSLQSEVPQDQPVFRASSIELFSIYKKISGVSRDTHLPVGQLTDDARGWKARFFKWIRTSLFVPDGRIGWIPLAYKTAKEIIRNQDIQVIFSSSPPHSLQLVSSWLKKKFNIPLVVDFRDPWTKIQYYQRTGRNKISRIIDEKLERTVLENADHLTTVSSSVAQSFLERLTAEKTLSHSILPNGWDSDDFSDVDDQESEHFTILHSGNLNVTQNPEVLLKTVRKLLNEEPENYRNVRIRFIGRVHPVIREVVNSLHLENHTEFHPYMTHQSIIGEMCRAGLLFSVIPLVPDNKGIVMSKNFEYMGTGRPILIIGPVDSDIGQIISEFSNSIICNYDDETSCEKFLRTTIINWRNKTEKPPDSAIRQKYSRKEITRRLAAILDDRLNRQ